MAAGNNSLMQSIKPFNGTGFSNWEFRVKLLLEQSNVLNVLNQEPPTDVQLLEAFRKSDVKARNIIVQCLADNMLEIIKTKETAQAMLKTLQDTYQKKGISTQVALQKKLRGLRYTEGRPLTVIFTEFEQTVFKLRGAGGHIENTEVISQLLSAMPDTYQAVTTATDIMFGQDESKVTLDFVKNKLILEESRKVKCSQDEGSNDAVFTGYKKPNKGYKPGNKSHNQFKNKEYKPSFPCKCHGCGQIGHKKYACPKDPRNKFDQRANMVEQHVRMHSDSDDPDGGIVFVSMNNSESLGQEACFQSGNEKCKFIIDSGATNHLLCEQMEPYLTGKHNISHLISVAKQGEKIEAYVEGNLFLKSENDSSITIKNAWVCKGLFHNLLSVRKLEEAVLFKNKKFERLNV